MLFYRKQVYGRYLWTRRRLDESEPMSVKDLLVPREVRVFFLFPWLLKGERYAETWYALCPQRFRHIDPEYIRRVSITEYDIPPPRYRSRFFALCRPRSNEPQNHFIAA